MKGLSYYLRETGTPMGKLKEWLSFLILKDFNNNPKTSEMVINYIKKNQEAETRFAEAIIKAVSGNYLPLESFEGVKRLRRENQKIDVINLATKYYDHFENSKLFKSLKNNLFEGRYIV
jgi:hypothetical protein